MVTGIESFREWFSEYEDQYVIIGGTACDILMTEEGMNFRATKDMYISSLSAILLDEAYYTLLKLGKHAVDGVMLLDAAYLIPFKAKAWLDLKMRKESGEQIDSKNIRKHKNDVFRLTELLDPFEKISLPLEVLQDMKTFLENMKSEEVQLKQLGITRRSKDEILEELSDIYQIKETSTGASVYLLPIPDIVE